MISVSVWDPIQLCLCGCTCIPVCPLLLTIDQQRISQYWSLLIPTWQVLQVARGCDQHPMIQGTKRSHTLSLWLMAVIEMWAAIIFLGNRPLPLLGITKLVWTHTWRTDRLLPNISMQSMPLCPKRWKLTLKYCSSENLYIGMDKHYFAILMDRYIHVYVRVCVCAFWGYFVRIGNNR